MKRKLLWSIGMIMVITNLHGQPISPYLFGQNAWMPYAYGSQVYYGQLGKLWPKVRDSKVQMIRIGGHAPDINRPTNAQYIALIDSIRKIGAEPFVQVPYGNGAYTSTNAADIVTYINGTMGRKVKYWSISNEPDLAKIPIATVESYFKSFASAMKSVDPSITIVGPECAWYDAAYYNGLIGGANDITGKDANGRYYLDIVSFHSYPFDGTQTRSDVINYPSGGLTSAINALLTNINNANTKNGRSGGDALQWAITEFNINYQNPSSNTLAGVGVESFLNGQFWAEYFGTGMANGAFAMLPWSIHESSGDRSTYDLGYLDNNTTFVPRPTYYHESMMAGNFKGTVISSSDNQSLIKTFAAKDTNQISVMILNQDQTNGYPFTLQLDKTTVTGTSLAINVNAGIHRSIKDSIPPQSSWILVYDTTGTLVKKCIYSFDRATAVQAPVCYTQSPYTNYFDLPTTIQAEDFDNGGQNIAYYDATTGNQGGQYRNEDVDIEACQDTGGGYDIGWTQAGEWLEYSVNVTTTTIFDIEFRVASQTGSGAFHLELDGVPLTSSIVVPSTGGWQSWTTLTQKNISIPVGKHILRFYIEQGGFNLNYIMFTSPGTITGITNPTNNESLTVVPNPATDKVELLFNSTGSYDTFIIITDEQGNEFYSNYYSPSSQQKETVHVSGWENGIYFIYVNTGDTKITKKLIVE